MSNVNKTTSSNTGLKKPAVHANRPSSPPGNAQQKPAANMQPPGPKPPGSPVPQRSGTAIQQTNSGGAVHGGGPHKAAVPQNAQQRGAIVPPKSAATPSSPQQTKSTGSLPPGQQKPGSPPNNAQQHHQHQERAPVTNGPHPPQHSDPLSQQASKTSVGPSQQHQPLAAPAPTKQTDTLATNVNTATLTGLTSLENIYMLLVKQKIKTDLDTRNIYSICTMGGRQFMLATENQNLGGGGCCSAKKSYEINIADNTATKVMDVVVKKGADFAEVSGPPGKSLGRIVNDKTSPTPLLDVLDRAKKLLFRVKRPVKPELSEPSNFIVFSTDGQTQLGRITKTWGGFIQEATTDADNFEVIFPKISTVDTKALLLGVCMYIDLLFYDDYHEDQKMMKDGEED